jgi:hypothetical protein
MNAGWSENDLRREGFAEDSEQQQQRMATPTTSQTPRRPTGDVSQANTPAAPEYVAPIELFPTPGAGEGTGVGEDDDEEINRAILMSLQERQPSYANTDRPEPAEDLVQLLIGMGFARARSVFLLLCWTMLSSSPSPSFL